MPPVAPEAALQSPWTSLSACSPNATKLGVSSWRYSDWVVRFVPEFSSLSSSSVSHLRCSTFKPPLRPSGTLQEWTSYLWPGSVLTLEEGLELPLEIRRFAALFCRRERIHRRPIVVAEVS